MIYSVAFRRVIAYSLLLAGALSTVVHHNTLRKEYQMIDPVVFETPGYNGLFWLGMMVVLAIAGGCIVARWDRMGYLHNKKLNPRAERFYSRIDAWIQSLDQRANNRRDLSEILYGILDVVMGWSRRSSRWLADFERTNLLIEEPLTPAHQSRPERLQHSNDQINPSKAIRTDEIDPSGSM